MTGRPPASAASEARPAAVRTAPAARLSGAFRSAPAFWRTRGLLSTLLAPVGALVGFVATRRLTRLPEGAVAVPVIVVGNLVAGGAGKTPTARLVAEAAADRTPFLLARGYGGALEGPLRVDPARHTAAEVGDEPLVLARTAPTVIGRDRLAAARLAVAEGAGLLVLDDGFQNPRLARDVSILVVDAEAGVGNGRCLPAGPLRAPVAAQLARADALVVIGDGRAADDVVRLAERRRLAVVRGRTEPVAPERFAGLRVIAFAGIGRPEKVWATLAGCGAEIVERRAFPDHHPFDEADAGAILAACDAHGLVPVTTEKDHVRLAGGPLRRALAGRALVVEIRLALEPPYAIPALVALARSRAAAREDADRAAGA